MDRNNLSPAQILDLARRYGIKGTEAALIEFVALVRDAQPLRPVRAAQPIEAAGGTAPVPTCTIRPEVGARGVMGYGVLDERLKLVGMVSVKSFEAAAAHPAHLARQAQPVIPAPHPTDESHFKNFHRSLCARFGYTHDEQYWWRDLVSLEEHLAARITRQAQPTDRDAEWISVEAALPEVETDVLVRGVRGDSVCHEVAGLFNGEWLGQNSERELRFTVTDWMPLPAIRALKGKSGSEGAADE